MKAGLAMTVLVALFAFSASAQVKVPRIVVIGPDQVDFGRYPARETKTARYTIQNAGDSVLKVLQVRKTCGCASASCDKQELAPNEKATVEIVILPNSIFGQYSKKTFVESNDPHNRFLRLTTSGNAVPLVAVKPQDSMYAVRIPTNTEWRQSFDITPTEPGVELGQLTTDSNYPVEVVTNRSARNRDDCCRLDVRILPTEKSGNLRCVVSIPVLAPTNQPPVRVHVSGAVGTELCAVPRLLDLPVSDEPITRAVTLRVLGVQSGILDPALLKLPDRADVSFRVDQGNDGRGLLVTATFSPEFTRQLYAEENIPLSFDLPGTSFAILDCRTKR
jgi:hypothetical protein